MAYLVQEIFYTLQGEGAQAGRAAVFCRFTGCNLWSGQPEQRAASACDFCDTEFVGPPGPLGGRYASPKALAQAIRGLWPQTEAAQPHGPASRPLCVLTGGEPTLQADEPLVEALHQAGMEVALESNGTRLAPQGVDWICVSPKGGMTAEKPAGQGGKERLAQTWGDELKLVYPQPQVDPAHYAGLAFTHFILQPLDNAQLEQNTQAALAYCLAHPQWRLGLQTHKLLRIP